MASTVFVRSGGERDSLDILPRNTPILADEFCAFIRAVENTVSIYTAFVTLGKQIDHNMLSHTRVRDRFVHHKSKAEFGVFFCMAECLIVEGRGQAVVTANGSCVFDTEYWPILFIINIDHKQLLFLPVLCAHALHDSGADGMACFDVLPA